MLRPEAAIVEAYLARPSEDQWLSFERAYTALLEERFSRDRAPFDALAALARTKDVLLGCNCPTRKNPDLVRCHTILALRFMKARYPDLEVRIPSDLRSP